MEPAMGKHGAEAFVETLNDLGVENIFLNPGIDLVPLMATIARYRAGAKKVPRVILCTDESVAVSAAHGSAMVSGKPQVVAVFEDVGTLQGGGALVNLKYGRIPVIVCAGSNRTPKRTDWLGQPADQRKILRDYVKWDHEITTEEDISAVVREAVRIASTEPCGPVYLTLGDGVLAGPAGSRAVSGLAPVSPPADRQAYPALLERAARALIASRDPLIMTAYAGRHPETVASLTELAETLGARVITTDLRMNFPSTHTLSPGIDAISGDSYDHYIAESDVLLLVDYAFPGPMEKPTRPRPDATIIHLDMEPLKNGAPLWDRPPDIVLEGNSARLLPLLNAVIARSLTDADRDRCAERSIRVGRENRIVKDGWEALGAKESARSPISSEWLCHCINEVIDEEAILVHMIPSNAGAFSHQIRRSKPGTDFSWGESAGSMGWPLGAALGAKLAAPERMVVSLVGDGGFIYGCPVAALWGSAAHGAPFLTIIFNNRSYAVFRDLMYRFYGDDILPGDTGFQVGIDIRNPPDFAAVARACNAYGEMVENPEDLMGALRRAVEHVKAGISAVLDVRI